jgi:hypothetical protein
MATNHYSLIAPQNTPLVRILFMITLPMLICLEGLSQKTFTVRPQKITDTTAAVSQSILNQCVMNVYFKNITTDTIRLNWKVTQRSLPAITPTTAWDYSMCDYETCRDKFLDSAAYTMKRSVPGFEAFLYFHVLPKDAGTGILKVYVYDDKHPAQGDTITWIVNAKITNIDERNNAIRFALYPNPVTDYLTLEGENVNLTHATIRLYNPLGSELMQALSNSNATRINTAALSAGVYFIKITTEQGVSVTKKIIK